MILFPLRRFRRATIAALAAGATTALAVTPCDAQARVEREVRIVRAPDGVTITREWPGDARSADRAVLGVVLGESARGDTAGVRLEAVEANGPAGRAGLKPGDILTAINGTSLQVTRDDAADPALAGLAQRRLQRVMASVKPGDELRLAVRSGTGGAGGTRMVTVQAVSAAALARETARVEERVITRGADGEEGERRLDVAPRGMVGVSVGSAGNARDTLGLFVSSVVRGGPAERAGIIEGERIAAVNGVDVRVPREDVDDERMATARTDRFVREVQKTEPGKTLTLRVWGNGRYRDVTVTAEAARDPVVGAFRWDGPRMPGRQPGLRFEAIPEVDVRIRGNGGEPQLFEFRRDGPARARLRLNGREVEIDGAGIEQAMEEMGRRLQERMREVQVDVRGRGRGRSAV